MIKKTIQTILISSFLISAHVSFAQSNSTTEKEKASLIDFCKTEYLNQISNKKVALHTLQFSNINLNESFSWFNDVKSFDISMNVSYQNKQDEPIPTYLIEAGKNFSSSQINNSTSVSFNKKIKCEVEKTDRFFKVVNIQEN